MKRWAVTLVNYSARWSADHTDNGFEIAVLGQKTDDFRVKNASMRTFARLPLRV